jgi:predicted metal-dependent phosphoesterase TrpH
MMLTMSDHAIDLHTHTTHSDGSATPTELIEAAAARGARAVAITDHDTVDGLGEARIAAARVGIELVNGIEISAEYSPGTMHVLGYYFDDSHSELLAELELLKQARKQRNPEIARRLRELGIDIYYDEVEMLAGNEVVGRPHFARLMVERGFAASIQDAFDRFLAKGAPAYVEKKRPSPAEAIALIHNACGVAVLAHPYQLKLSCDDTERLVRRLAEYALDGLEAIYSRHTAEQRAAYASLAERCGLLITGGSDYHGSYKPDISIVTGLGDLAVPYSLLQPLKERSFLRAKDASAN